MACPDPQPVPLRASFPQPFMPMRRHPFIASRLDETALAVLAFCFPGVAVLLPLGVVPLSLAVALVVALAEWQSGERFSRPAPAVGWAALLFAFWAVLSAAWAIDPVWSLETWARVVPTILAGGFLVLHCSRQPPERRQRLAIWLLAGFALAATIMVIEGVADRALNLVLAHLVDQVPDSGSFRLNRMNRGATALAILVWPAAAALAGRLPEARRWAVLLLPAAIAVLLSFFVSTAALVGCVIGLVVALMTLAAPRLAGRALLAAVAILLLVMPLVAQNLADRGWADDETLDLSLRHRVFIWNFTAEEAAKRPFTGWGLDASRDLASNDERFDAAHSALPLHPHNAALQIWVELGAIGVLLGGTLLLLVLARQRREPPLAAALDGGLAASFLAIGFISYGIWQYHWLVVPLAAAALMRVTPPLGDDRAHHGGQDSSVS